MSLFDRRTLILMPLALVPRRTLLKAIFWFKIWNNSLAEARTLALPTNWMCKFRP
jgi:hypothetical protein